MPDFFAQRRPQSAVANTSAEWRLALDIPLDCWAPDLISILEHRIPELIPEFQCVIQEDNYLQGAGAKTTFDPPRIFVAQSIWNRANNGDGFARFTLAHEIGHLILHPGEARHRMMDIATRPKHIPADCSGEKQADWFASHFLLPAQVVREFSDSDELRAACKVSQRAAEIAFEQHVTRFRKRERPQCVRDYLEEFRRR